LLNQSVKPLDVATELATHLHNIKNRALDRHGFGALCTSVRAVDVLMEFLG